LCSIKSLLSYIAQQCELVILLQNPAFNATADHSTVHKQLTLATNKIQ